MYDELGILKMKEFNKLRDLENKKLLEQEK